MVRSQTTCDKFKRAIESRQGTMPIEREQTSMNSIFHSWWITSLQLANVKRFPEMFYTVLSALDSLEGYTQALHSKQNLESILHPFYRCKFGWAIDGLDFREPGQIAAQKIDIVDDFIRLFAEVRGLDIRRAVWCFALQPNDCEPVVRRFMEARKRYMDRWLNFSYDPDDEEKLAILGQTFWHVSCHVPRSLLPEPPPPPYTLYAFNIELPEIVLPPATRRQFVPAEANRVAKRKSTYSADIEHVRKQRLFRFGTMSSAPVEETQKNSITEIID
jgi:hypothetical protein